MPPIDWIASIVAAVSAFVIGGLWYSPLLFAKPWQQDTGLSDEQLAAASKGKIFGLSFVFSLLAAVTFSMFLGPDPSVGFGLGAGACAGIFWVAASFGINYQFELKPTRLLLINGGYHAVQFTVYGLVLGLL
jgi:Protein of unknown function (DUF1761)